MQIILFSSAFHLVLVFVELIPQYKQNKKSFYLYAALLSISYIFWVLYGLGVEFGSPAEGIAKVVRAIFQLKE